ncbi:MAG: tRNA dimethylallyltransferase [Acidimicrobiales bacterium]|nr:tRNA dimethylallyltransferase [Acidimicrobiales bacterium]
MRDPQGGPARRPVVAEGTAPPLAILGVTASGKSALAMELARVRGDVELVSVDSMQVYRGMDVGTAKPTAAEQAEVRHHAIDLVDPWDPFDVATFQDAVRSALADISARRKRAVLVGGTGLYLRAVVDDLELPGRFPEVAAGLEAEPDTVALHSRLAALDPRAASRMEPTNRRRVVRALEVTVGSGRPFSSYGAGLDAYPASPVHLVGLWLPRPVVADRIGRRYHQQVADGFVAEVERLAAGPLLSHTAAQALGYRELLAHLRGEKALDEALAEAVTRTRQFARRQRAWFRRDPRISWLGATNDPLVALPALLAEASTLWD